MVATKIYHCQVCGWETEVFWHLRVHHRAKHPKDILPEEEIERGLMNGDLNPRTVLPGPDEFVLAFINQLTSLREQLNALHAQKEDIQQTLMDEREKNRKLAVTLNELRYRNKTWQDQLKAASGELFVTKP